MDFDLNQYAASRTGTPAPTSNQPAGDTTGFDINEYYNQNKSREGTIDPTFRQNQAEQKLLQPNLSDNDRVQAEQDYIQAHIDRQNKGFMYRVNTNIPSLSDMGTAAKNIASSIADTGSNALNEFFHNPISAAVGPAIGAGIGLEKIGQAVANTVYTGGMEIGRAFGTPTDVAKADLLRLYYNKGLDDFANKLESLSGAPATAKIGELVGTVLLPEAALSTEAGQAVASKAGALSQAAKSAAQTAGAVASKIPEATPGIGNYLKYLTNPTAAFENSIAGKLNELDRVNQALVNPETSDLLRIRPDLTPDKLIDRANSLTDSINANRRAINKIDTVNAYANWALKNGVKLAAGTGAGAIIGGAQSPTAGNAEAVAGGALIGGAYPFARAGTAEAIKRINDAVDRAGSVVSPLLNNKKVDPSDLYQKATDILNGKTPVENAPAQPTGVSYTPEGKPQIEFGLINSKAPEETPTGLQMINALDNEVQNIPSVPAGGPIMPKNNRVRLEMGYPVGEQFGPGRFGYAERTGLDPRTLASFSQEVESPNKITSHMGDINDSIISYGHDGDNTLTVKFEKGTLDHLPIQRYVYTNFTPELYKQFVDSTNKSQFLNKLSLEPEGAGVSGLRVYASDQQLKDLQNKINSGEYVFDDNGDFKAGSKTPVKQTEQPQKSLAQVPSPAPAKPFAKASAPAQQTPFMGSVPAMPATEAKQLPVIPPQTSEGLATAEQIKEQEAPRTREQVLADQKAQEAIKAEKEKLTPEQESIKQAFLEHFDEIEQNRANSAVAAKLKEDLANKVAQSNIPIEKANKPLESAPAPAPKKGRKKVSLNKPSSPSTGSP